MQRDIDPRNAVHVQYNNSRAFIDIAQKERIEAIVFAPPTNRDSCVPVRGTVYGVALYAGEPVESDAAASGEAIPYSPVLFIKLRDTFFAGMLKIMSPVLPSSRGERHELREVLGDEVVAEIEQIGALMSTIIAEAKSRHELIQQHLHASPVGAI